MAKEGGIFNLGLKERAKDAVKGFYGFVKNTITDTFGGLVDTVKVWRKRIVNITKPAIQGVLAGAPFRKSYQPAIEKALDAAGGK